MKQRIFYVFIGTALLLAGLIGILTQSASDLSPAFQPISTPPDLSDQGFAPYIIELEDHATAPTLAPTEAPLTPYPTQQDAGTEIGEEEVYDPNFTGIPDRIVIDAIDLDAPVVPTTNESVRFGSTEYIQWLAPNKYAAGWHDDSAILGSGGNTVINGHHNVYGEVFKNLLNLKSGDMISVYSGKHRYDFRVTNLMITPERFASVDVRLDNARWIAPSEDTRLTLVTCWPYESNTHRLIVVAQPVRQWHPDE